MSIQAFINQLAECRNNNCPDCEKCIHSAEALDNMPIKLKKIKLSNEYPEYDNIDPDLTKWIEKFRGEII